MQRDNARFLLGTAIYDNGVDFLGSQSCLYGECTGCASVGATFLMLVDKCKLHSWGRYTMAPYALRLDLEIFSGAKFHRNDSIPFERGFYFLTTNV